MTNDYTPPDPYEHDLKTLRAAASTPESRFEDAYKESRRRDLAAEGSSLAKLRAAHARAMTAAELSAYEPPNGYQIALDKMRSATR